MFSPTDLQDLCSLCFFIPQGREGLQVNPINLPSPCDPPLFSPQTCKGKETSQPPIASLQGNYTATMLDGKLTDSLKDFFPA